MYIALFGSCSISLFETYLLLYKQYILLSEFVIILILLRVTCVNSSSEYSISYCVILKNNLIFCSALSVPILCGLGWGNVPPEQIFLANVLARNPKSRVPFSHRAFFSPSGAKVEKDKLPFSLLDFCPWLLLRKCFSSVLDMANSSHILDLNL